MANDRRNSSEVLATPGPETVTALLLADRMLDRPGADPDDDLAVLSRQLRRAWERIRQLAALAVAASPSPSWRPIKDAPTDGTRFLAHFIDLVDEYDEDDRLIARAVPTPGVVVAYWVDWLGGIMEYPYAGNIIQGRRYVAWHTIPHLNDPSAAS